MIYTVTLNPALDKTIIVNNFEINNVNRVQKIREDAGGKGINVSKMISNLGGKNIAIGALAGSIGNVIRQQLAELDIQCDFLEIDGNTRTNIKVVDLLGDTYTDINEQGTNISTEELKLIEEKLFKQINEGDILVLAGSVPESVDSDIYAKWIRKAKQKGIRTILDGDGELLEKAIEEGPYLIKPNIHEFERLFKTEFYSEEEVIKQAEKLFQYGVEIIVISRGEKGAILLTIDKNIVVDAIKGDVKSTAGAGDSMVGALAYATDKNYSLEDAIALAVASSTATVQNEGTMMGSIDEINEYRKQVTYRYI
ncbi:1-phosphofructokinase [Vallitalea okinawensis]|uniref:1-phosphofructokinase n=1 Tax=Vallitalea okinawensis TaxID=2078660 RepID=UPI000CFDD807|nr:1-phosphofructokinase [Vallitalea okinawensis]